MNMTHIERVHKNHEFMTLLMESISKHRKFRRPMTPDTVSTAMIIADLENYPLGGYRVMTEEQLDSEILAFVQFLIDYEETSERYDGYFKHLLKSYKQKSKTC